MKEKGKKIITFSIILFMVLNYLLPLVNYAEFDLGSIKDTIVKGLDETQEEIGREYEIKETEEWDISENGDGKVIAKWKLEDRSLTISGTGKMKDWKWDFTTDWHKNYYRIIEKIVIENGVTNIGEYAFFYCRNLTNMTISETITSIEKNAFYECSSLTNVIIPESVIDIESYVFENCSSLTSINIPNSVTNIESSAFNGCNSLTEIKVLNNNTKYTSIDGVLYNKEQTQLIKYPSKKSDKEYSIPNTVTMIEYKSFEECSNLIRVTIPNSVIRIGYSTFIGCSSLKSITIPDSVTNIDWDMFERCSSLTEINVSENHTDYTSIDGVVYNKERTILIKYPSKKSDKEYSIPNTVTMIESKSFEECSSLINVTIPNSVTSIGYSTFIGCSSLKRITIPDSVTSIGSSAFKGCSSLTSINIPNSVTSIDKYTFEGCSSLTNVIISQSVTSIGSCAFEGCSSLTNLIIPNSVTKLEYGVFGKCSSLINITIPDSVTDLDNALIWNAKYIICKTNSYAHKYAEEHKYVYFLSDNVTSNYTTEYQIKETAEWDISENGDRSVIARWKLDDESITISGTGKMKEWDSTLTTENWKKIYNKLIKKIIIENGVTNIGENAFSECSSLTNVIIAESVTSIGSSVFNRCSSLTNVIIPEGVTSIESSAFNRCSSLTNITIPNSVTNIGINAFKGCDSLTEIKVLNNNTKYTSIDGVLYNKEQTRLIKYPSKKIDKEYSVSNSVTSLDRDAFEKCSILKRINLPNGLISISYEAFKECSSLTNIIIPENVIDIELYAFSGCSSLTSVNIPNSVTNIGGYAFYECSSLTSVNIPNSVTNIGNYAFYGCSSLTSVNIPNSVTSIGSNAFRGCSKLKEINVSENNEEYTSIDGVLYNKEQTQLIKYPSPKRDKEYSIPNTVTMIEQRAFEECSSLISVNIPNSITNISIGAFYGCSSLSRINIPNSVTTIEEKAFYGCDNLKSITIPDSVTKINDTSIWSIQYIICRANSYTHQRAEYAKSLYVLDNEGPIVELSKNGESELCKGSSTKVQIKDIISGVNEDSIKYVWSNKEIITKDEITEKCTNGEIITTPNDISGDYYLYIYAEDVLQNETIYKSNVFKIDNLAPIIDVEYNPTEKTNQNVTVRLIANEEIQGVKGWTLSKDKKELTKQYKENIENQEIIIKDVLGNETKQTIKVSNIDKTAPTVTVTYSSIDKPEQSVTVTLTANEEVQEIAGWTLSEDKKRLSKEYEKNVTNEEIIVKDIAGNEIEQTVTISNIDRKAPEVTVEYSSKERTKENVIVTIKADEELQELEGWKLSEDKKVLIKEYEDSITENVAVKDIAGNETKQTITITNIDKKGPKISVKYSTTEKTNQNVKVTLTTDEETEGVEGWTLSEDKKTLTKTYKKNTTETVSLKDLLGNETKQTIKVSNIDKTAPTVTVTYSSIEKPEQSVTVTLTANEEVQEIAGWTLSEDKKRLSKEYEKNVTNEEIIVKDIAGNEIEQTVTISNIDRKAPEVTVEYSSKERTKENVIVTIKADEELQGLEGWKLSEDKKILTKEYEDSVTENLAVKDIAGNETKQTIKITNIDKKGPKIDVKYSTTEKTNQNVTVTLTADEEVGEVEGWTLSKDKKTLTKTYTENKTETMNLKDELGNETKQTVTINNIDKIVPIVTVKYSTTAKTNQNVVVTINANEEVQAIAGWTLSEDKKTLTKTYIENKTETIIIKDLVGNETKQTITINNIDKTLKTGGDINENNKIDIGDILLIKRHMAYTNSTIVANKHSNWKLSDEKIQIGDLNNNGKIDIGDILKLQRYISASNSKEVAQKHKEWLSL